MRDLIALHEQVDEVNYFLREWQRLATSDDPAAKIVKKPEIRFVSHSLRRVVHEASQMDIPLVLRTGEEPVLVKQKRHDFRWMIPSSSTVNVTDYHRLTNEDGQTLSYVATHKGMLSLWTLAQTIAKGGELQIAGAHKGDWAA